MTIRVRILASIIGMSILIIILGLLVSSSFTRTQLLRSIERDLLALANTADRLLSSEIDLLKSEVSVAALHLVEAEANGEDVHKVLQELLDTRNDFWALTVLDGGAANERGNRIVDFVGSPPVHREFIDSDYVRRAMAGEGVISTTRIDPASGKLVLHVCVPMGRNRVLIATINGMFFSNVLEDLTVWETGHVTVIDAEGYILANPRRNWVEGRQNFINAAKGNLQYQKIAGMVTEMTRGKTGMDMYSVDGHDRFCFYRPITSSSTGWSLGVVGPVAESPLKDSSTGTWIVGLSCIALCIALAIPISSYLETPYRTISRIMGEMEEQQNRLRSSLEEMERQQTLLRVTNETAKILLHSKAASFEHDLYVCMGIMTQSVKVDRMRIFQNYPEGEDIRAVLVYEWQKDKPEGPPPGGIFFMYSQAPCWSSHYFAGRCVNSVTRDLPPEEQKLLAPSHSAVLSILTMPIFCRDALWGCASFDNIREEQAFSAESEVLLSSGVMMIANALERNEMETALIHAQQEAVTSAEAKSRFLANMSHEMRTPLNAIIGLSEMTLYSDGLVGENRENLDKIYDSGGILLGLINDILDLSKIESGKFEIIPVEYELPSLINDTVTLNSTRIGSKPLGFHLHIDESLPSVLRGDDLRIKQLLNNLLSNAFKYTKQGRVDWTVKCKRDGDSVWFISTIKDTGIGIRPEDMENLFSDYNQVDTKANRKIEGTGLGLSITKKIAEMMDGSIAVESEYGLGSTFTLRIRQGYVNDIPIGEEVAEKLRNFKYSTAKRDRRKIVRVAMPYARVLVVDDMPINLSVAKGLLKRYSMEIDCVSSGLEAITAIREEKVRYDAVFMDHMMPEMDGVETVHIIREKIGTGYAKNIPIIALTADAVVGKREMFLSNGFQDFLPKPIDVRALDTILNRWVRNRAKETDPGNAVPSESGDVRETIFENWEIGDIDVEKGLINFDGVIESYLDILGSYVKDMPSLLDNLRNYMREDDIAGYQIAVHSVKSANRIIGAEELGARAEALETAAKNSDGDFIKEACPGFITAEERLIAKIASFLSRREEANPKPVKGEPDQAVLAELLEACKSLNIAGVNRAMEKLESFRYESRADLIPWLWEQIDVSDFSAMVERLSG